ncbi:MAG: 50S ribosomal protein L9 [Candidatus Omnitrophica bacterium]|nr:50S ribosomal protein L9 [Candidatus Omnitrophota bacterium]
MEVILCHEMANLGKTGDVVKVKDGYARNFLFPRNMALAATKANLKKIEAHKAKLAAIYEQKKNEALALAEKIGKVSCTLTVEVNDQEKLYGAVSEKDILHALEQEGFKYERKDLVIEKAVEELGIFEIGIKLHPEVTAKFRLWVTKK